MKRRGFFKAFAKVAVIALAAPEIIRKTLSAELPNCDLATELFWYETKRVAVWTSPTYERWIREHSDASQIPFFDRLIETETHGTLTYDQWFKLVWVPEHRNELMTRTCVM